MSVLKIVRSTLLGFTACAVTMPAVAQSDSQTAELDAIHRAAKNFESAFNSGKARAVAALWTEDGEYIDSDGNAFRGRKAIQDEYQSFFAAHKGQQIKIIIDDLRVLSDTAAMEEGRAILEPAPPGAPATSRYTAVHVKEDGKWRMATVRDERVEVPSAYDQVADLEWLIGTWTAEEHGAKMVSECRWVANKCFVERTHTVTRPDHTTTTGVQLIGYNPRMGRVQSWDFSAGGGHAVGTWTPTDNGYQAQVVGMTGDGTSTTAVNLLTRIDDSAYSWQSVNRTLGDTSLPDTDEIVIRRGKVE